MSVPTPPLYSRCADCHHPEMPICGCQVDPALKSLNTVQPGRRESALLRASKWHSSRIGWPGPIKQPTRVVERPTFRARVGVDMTALQSVDSRRRGIGRYSLGLLNALARTSPDVQFLLYANFIGTRQYGLPDLPNITERPIKIPVADAVAGNPDQLDTFLILSPAQSRIRAGSVPRIVSVLYDLIPEVLAGDQSSTWSGYADEIRDYDHFFAISEFTRHDFITRKDFDPTKITTVLPGLDLDFWSPGDEVPYHPKINRPFLLCVGSDEPRKGNNDAIAAMAQLPEAIRSRFQLVFAHATSVYHSRQFEKDASAAKVDLVMTGECTDVELRSLYRTCTAFLFPSHYEGFGLPVIEAMACGAPVIVADNSSLPEVVGNAALVVETSKPESLAGTLQFLLESPDLQTAMRKIGRDRAESFTWESSIPAVAKIIAPISVRLHAQPESIILIQGQMTAWTGYGRIAINLGMALERIGIHVQFQSIARDPRYHGLPEFVTDRLIEHPTQPWVLRIDVPMSAPDERPYVHFTMWEATGLPSDAVEKLNQAMAVILPCSWNASCFSAKGVKRPIRLAPIGLSASDGFTTRPLPTSGPFRFGMAARISHGGIRKGIAEGIEAFTRAFPDDPDVAIDVKLFPDCVFPEPSDSRVTLNRTPMQPPEMADWYDSIDCLFVPSKGEGWGMHTHEAMACGRPVIASLFGGTAEFCDRSTSWPLDFTLESAREFYDDGHWIVPTMPSMVRTLQRVRSLRGSAEFQAKADAAAIRAAEFTWERSALAVRDTLVELGLLARSKPRVPLGTPHCVTCR